MPRRTAVMLLTGVAVWTIDGCTAAHDREVRAASVVYVRSDTDDTTVVSPTVEASGKASEAVTVDTRYTIDAWSGASIDVVSAATHTIRERRHEGQAGVGYDDGTTRLNGRYRVSYEHDYQSHGVVLGASRDLAKHNTTLSLSLTGSRDLAGRAGDPRFAQEVYSYGLHAGLSQVLDPLTVVSLSLETTVLDGYQASAYRWVAVGADGVCASGAPYCVPELVPDLRIRTTASGGLRHAIGEHASFGLSYRFYHDDWGIGSHTVEPTVTWLPGDTSSLTFHVRYYTQGEASFYRPRYFHFDDAGGYLTRDRKLSAFYASEVGVAYGKSWELEESERVIELGVRASLSRLTYLAYVGLDTVTAGELTTLLGMTF